jgi:hypothetical protein
MAKLAYPMKITFGEMRASGVRDLLIYLLRLQVQPFHDGQRRSLTGQRVRLSDIEPLFVLQGLREAWRRCPA